MLSPKVRLRLTEIANRISNKEEVSLEDMVWATKWANRHSHASHLIRNAQRTAFSGDEVEDDFGPLLRGLDLGDPDPKNHLIGPQNPETLGEWFKTNDGENDRLRRD